MYNSENLDALIESFSSHGEGEGVEKKAEQTDTGKDGVSAELEAALNKQASTTQDNGDSEDMSKQAEEAGRTLAGNILSGLHKRATDDVAKNQMLADQQRVEEMPTPVGTVDQVMKGIVERAAQHGAVSENEMVESATAGKDATNSSTPTPAPQGMDPADDRTMAKAAAVSELVRNHGFTFDDAIAHVKQASDQYEDEMQKAAAVEYLTDQGFSSDDAVALVKAAAEDLAREAGQTKQASISDYVGAGYSFDEAVELVKQASQSNDEDAVSEQEKVAAYNAFVEGGMDSDSALRAVQILSQ